MVVVVVVDIIAAAAVAAADVVAADVIVVVGGNILPLPFWPFYYYCGECLLLFCIRSSIGA